MYNGTLAPHWLTSQPHPVLSSQAPHTTAAIFPSSSSSHYSEDYHQSSMMASTADLAARLLEQQI